MEELLDAAVKAQDWENTIGAISMISMRKSWENLGRIKSQARRE